MTPAVKFCGMTRADDIRAAESLGVGYIGFVFVPSSPRSVTLDEAVKLRQSVKHAKVVGVFMEDDPETINRTADTAMLDFIQLHGAPSLSLVTSCSKPVIQAFRGTPDIPTAERFLQVCPFILIDKAEGENGVDLASVAALPAAIRAKLFLAGGLGPDTVRSACDLVRPFAVDCARGIESEPGKKSMSLMTAFIHNLPS